MPSRIAVSITIFMVGLASLAGCSHKPGGSDDGESATSGVPNAEVTLTKVARADVRETAAVSGTVAALPNQDVRVSALIAGRIAEMKVAEGDGVHAGQV